MSDSWVTLEVDRDPMDVYVARPDASGVAPGVIVIQHAGGVDAFIQETCDRLAAAGYVAAAPNLYHRQKDNILGEVADMPPGPERLQRLMEKLGKFNDDEIVRDVQATLDLLREYDEIGPSPIGVTGFCMGGRVVFLAAARVPGLAAGGMFYPAAMAMPWGIEGPAPIEQAEAVGCPLIGFFGNDDTNPTPELVAQIDDALTKYGKEHRFHAYDGAGHAFMDFSNPHTYREHAAHDAWPKLLAFFDETLKGVAA